jgi:curved DNA-binding protein CbpA
MTAKDYHYILGVSKDSGPEVIKAAYIKLALKFHPDKNAGDKYFEDRFKDIQEAYEALINNPSKVEFEDKGFKEGKKSADFNSVYPPSIEYFAVDKKRANLGDRIHLRWKVWHADIIQISCLEDLQSNIGSANFHIPKDGDEMHFNVDLLAMNSITGSHDIRNIQIELEASDLNKKSNAPKDERLESEKIINKASIPKGDSNEFKNGDGALGKPVTKQRSFAWILPSAIALTLIGLIFGLGWWLYDLVFNTKQFSNSVSIEDYIGTWCNSNELEVGTGDVFQLTISNDQAKDLIASYYNGGPFQETSKGIFLDNNNLDLYYDYVEGSMSLMSGIDENIISQCKKSKYAKCILIEKNKLMITTYYNDCSYMPENMNIVLRRLDINESCRFN